MILLYYLVENIGLIDKEGKKEKTENQNNRILD